MGARGAQGLAVVGGLVLLVIGWLALRPASVSAPPKSSAQVVATPVDPQFARLLPLPLRALALGMTVKELVAERPRAEPIAQLSEAGQLAYGEPLGADTQAIYLLDATSRTLLRVQLATQLTGERDIEPRIRQLEALHGPPSGVWDCEAKGAPPTRRIGWFRGRFGLVEAFLIVNERIAVTRYLARAETLRASLAEAACAPVPAERFSKFPVSPPTR